MEVMMKELGEIITGNTPSKKTEEFWNSEDICFVKPDIIADNGVNEIVDSNEYISEDARKKARVVGKNSIFVTCIGSIGKIGIASDGECAFNQQINAIIPNDRVQPKYLAYNLLFNKPRLVAIANAPVVPIINKSQFGEFTVNIETDIDRQREIVDVLDKLTQIIQQRNKEISALDDLIKARFVEMFGDPEQNEKGWRTCRLGDECTVINGRAYKAEELLDEGKYRVLRVGNFFTNDSWYYSDLELDNEKYCDEGDLLFAWSASFGPRIWHGEKVIYHYHIWKLIGYENCLNKDFFVELLNYNCDVMKRGTHGSTMLHFTKSQMEDQLLILPPMQLQEQFADFVHQVDKSKVAVQKALDETQILFDSLMQKYFG